MSDYTEDRNAPPGFMPNTALAAYAMMRTTGQDRTNQYRVYRFIGWAQDDPAYHGGISRANVKMAFGDVKDSFGPRIAELRRMGLIYRSHEKPNDAHDDGATPMPVIANRTTDRAVPLELTSQPREYLLLSQAMGPAVDVFPRPLLNMEEVDIAVRAILGKGILLEALTILRIWHGGKRDCVPCDMPEELQPNMYQRELF